MHCLPVIYRELQVAARRSATYQQRTLAGAAASGAVVLFSIFAHASSGSGADMFHVVAWTGFILCLLLGTNETADSLAQERREGTLGLLFLTDLRGYDIVIGKLTAASVRAFSILLAMLPAFALPIWLGGVTAGECWRVMVTLLAALLLSMSAGLFISSLVKGPVAAMAGSYLLVAILVLPPLNASFFGLPQWLAGPLGMFLNSSAVPSMGKGNIFGQAALYTALLSLTLIGLAGFAAAKFSANEATSESENWFNKLLRPSQSSGQASLKDQPAEWLARRMLPGRKLWWLLCGILAFICFLAGWKADNAAPAIIIPIQIIIGFMIKLWVPVVAVQPLNSARRNGALELLLCSPLSASTLVRGHLKAFVRYFMWPSLFAAYGLTIAGYLGGTLSHNEDTSKMCGYLAGFGTLWLLFFLLDLYALIYVGLWHGLKEPQAHQAATKTIVRVLVLPWITVIVPCVGILGFLGWPIFWILWGSQKLNKQFYKEATSQYSTDTSGNWFKRNFLN